VNFSWVIPNILAGSKGPVFRDDLLYLKVKGVRAIVRMEEETVSGEEIGLIDLAEFVPDMYPPTISQAEGMLAFLHQQIDAGLPVVVSCKHGVGRTGTVLACYLVDTGYSAGDAVKRVRHLRPGSLESSQQQQFVHTYERWRANGAGQP